METETVNASAAAEPQQPSLSDVTKVISPIEVTAAAPVVPTPPQSVTVPTPHNNNIETPPTPTAMPVSEVQKPSPKKPKKRKPKVPRDNTAPRQPLTGKIKL